MLYSFLSESLLPKPLWRVLSLMTTAWTDQWNCYSVGLVKWKIQVKNIFGYSYKEFYTYALKRSAGRKLEERKTYKSIWSKRKFETIELTVGLYSGARLEC